MAGRASSTRTGAGRTTVLLARAVLLLAATLAGLHVGAPPARAAGSCAGVTVVVTPPHADPSVSCLDAAGSASAAQLFEETGRELTRVQRFPGAVCRVNGVPAGQACVAMPPADAYWGFFVSDGGRWQYSSLGVDAVTPTDGDSIALVWQDVAEHRTPTVPPGAGEAAAAGSSPAGDSDGAGPDEGGSVPTLVAASLVVGLGGAAVVLTRRRR